MNKKKFILSTLTGCLCLAAFSSAAAADGGPYLAADSGRAHFSGNEFDNAFLPSGWTSSVSDTASAYRLTLGYQFTPNWGLEAGYVDLGHGTVTYSNPTPDPFQPGIATMVSYRIGAKGPFVAGTGTWPIDEQWSLYARAGVISSELDYQLQTNGISPPTSVANSTNTAWEATYGVGAKWNFLPQWGLRLGWDRYRNLGNAGYNANLLSLGVEWRF